MIEQLTQDIADWFFQLPAISIYAMLFVIAYMENVLPPIPGDLFIVWAGYLVAEGVISFFPTLALTTVASVFGFMTMFTLGWFWGDEIKQKKGKFWLFKYVHMKYYARAKVWMSKWGQGVILANRFLAGTRTVISFTSGLVQTRVDLTVVSSMISSLLWNSLLLFVGWLIKENWEVIGRYFDIYSLVIIVLLTLVAFMIYRGNKWKKIRQKAIRAKKKYRSGDI